MILVTGATGHLGVVLVPRLIAAGAKVRVLTRNVSRARQRLGDAPEVVLGDAQSPRTLDGALEGVDSVVSAMTGFGPGGLGVKAIDRDANLNLFRAAEEAGVRRFVLMSMYGASAGHPMELARMKYHAEEVLRASRLDWVIVRPNAFMELWVEIVAGPIMSEGKATVFGRGENLVNFNSVTDVARFAQLALSDPGLSRTTLSVGGPENITFNELVRQVERSAGRRAEVKHIPLPVMRLLSVAMRPFKPDVAGMVAAGVAMDTVDMTFDASDLRRRFPEFELTRLADVLGRQVAATTTR